MTQEPLITGIAFWALFETCRLLSWAIFLAALISTLLSFGVLDSRNRAVWMISDFLFKITDPVLRPIRAILPNLGSFDMSPVVAIILLQAVMVPVLNWLHTGIVYGIWQPLV